MHQSDGESPGRDLRSETEGSTRRRPPLHDSTQRYYSFLDAETPTSYPADNRRHMVLPDPVAIRFLEEDPAVTVVERQRILIGYELYLVEQWVCSRQSPTMVIATYTGDQRQSIVVGVLDVPADENTWSPRLRLYFKAINRYRARPKETPLGDLMVTNLNSFPSALTVVSVPDGNVRKNRQIFIVNEDLKRLGCSGRSALTMSEPSPVTQAKFYQLYRISDRVPFHQAVLELVKLCQAALVLFGKLEQEYIDGLLCDATETAIGNWWTEVGAEHYNFEPTDGILGPSTVSALLGMLMGARNRLHHYGVPVPKDVFELENTKRGIAQFQKAQKLEKSRRLDRQTLLKLHSVTAKAAAGDVWGVQKAVKSTVTEIGGKRGEMVIGMVSGREKSAIGDVETLDLERFISLAQGERAKWLWLGKPRRTFTDPGEKEKDIGGLLLAKEEAHAQPGRRSRLLTPDDESDGRKKEDLEEASSDAVGSAIAPTADSPGDKDASRKKVFKSVAGKMSDARSGLGRIKDAVGGGLRGHATRHSVSARDDHFLDSTSSTPITLLQGQQSATLSSPIGGPNRAFTWKNKPEEYLRAYRAGELSFGLEESPMEDGKATIGSRGSDDPNMQAIVENQHRRLRPRPSLLSDTESGPRVSKGTISVVSPPPFPPPPPPSIRVDESRRQSAGIDKTRYPELEMTPEGKMQLRRRHSTSLCNSADSNPLNENRWPRRMSFSEAEEAVLGWEELVDFAAIDVGNPATLDMPPITLIELTRTLNASIQNIKDGLQPWAESKLADVDAVDSRLAKEHETLSGLYGQLSEAHQRKQQGSIELVGEERARAAEGMREVEMLLARLDYEIEVLVPRVEDVEDGVMQLEKHVDDVERRAEELKVQLETEGYLHFLVRTLTGIGSGPNITQPRT